MSPQMTEMTPRKSGFRPLVAVLLAIVAVAVIYVVIRKVIVLPRMPYNVREMFPSAHRGIYVAVFSTMLIWLGIGPIWVGDFLSRRARYLPYLPLWSATIGLVSWAMLRFAVTRESLWDILGSQRLGWGGDWELIGRFVALQSIGTLMLLMATVTLASVVRLGWRGGLRRGAAGLLFGGPWVVLAWAVVVRWTYTDNLTELIRSTPFPWTGPAFLSTLLGVISLNSSILCYVWLRRGWLERVIATAATPLLAAGGFGLLWLGLEPAVEKYGTTFPAARFLLGPDRATFMSLGELALRWGAVQIAVVAVLTAGGLIALCLRPRHDYDAPDLPNQNIPRGWGRVYMLITLVYAAFLIYGSLLPLSIQPIPFGEALDVFEASMRSTQAEWSQSDMVTNTAMFVPLAFCALGAWSSPGRRLAWCWKAPVILVCGIVFGILLEFNQVYVASRVASPHDIIAQTLGSVLGLAAWAVFGIPLTLWVGGLVRESDRPALRMKLLYVYSALFVLYSVMPLSLTISVGQIWRKYKAGMINFIPFWGSGELEISAMVMKTAFYVPIGYMFACRSSRPGRGPLMSAAVGGLIFAMAIEAFQVLVHSRYATATDVVLGTIGAVIGSMLCWLSGPISRGRGVHGAWWRLRGVWFKILALAGWVLLMVHQRWEMLEVRRSWTEMVHGLELALSRPPLQMVNSGGPLDAVPRLGQEFAAFLVLGMILQALLVSFRRRGICAVAIGVVLMLGLELGRLPFSQYLPDYTLVLAAIAGVVASFWAYPRSVAIFLTPASLAKESQSTGP